LKKFNRDLKRKIVGITPAAMGKITSYGLPGNVRQLENVLKRAMLLCQGEWILDDQLLLEVEERRESSEVRDRRTFENLVDSLFEELTGNPLAQEGLDMVSAIEKGLIIRALQKTNGNQVQAASLLGINRSTLRGKMDRFHIKKEVLVSEEE
jgi:DNA-binding NtrC family response regulator